MVGWLARHEKAQPAPLFSLSTFRLFIFTPRTAPVITMISVLSDSSAADLALSFQAMLGTCEANVEPTTAHMSAHSLMLSGLGAADVALLVVDPTPGVFEAHMEDGAIEDGVPSQTREHLMMLGALSIKQIVVAVSKMDGVGHSQQRFLEVVAAMRAAMKKVGLPSKEEQFVPVAAVSGDNGE